MPGHGRSLKLTANRCLNDALVLDLATSGRARGLAAALAALVSLSLVACVSDQGSSERTASRGAALNANPVLQDFVLYGERSVTVGAFTTISGGDVGARANAAASFGAQIVVAHNATVDPSAALIAPSIALGPNASVGEVETSNLVNNGARVAAQGSFPSSMPPLPLAGRSGSGQAVSVGSQQSVSLTPGSYGAVVVEEHGALHLAPGTYSFASLTMDEHGALDSSGSDVEIHVQGALSLASFVTLGDQNAKSDYLHITVAGFDSASSPAASIGGHSHIAADVAVPRGNLVIADHVNAAGAFAAFDVSVGEYSAIEYRHGLTPSPGAQQQLAGHFTPPISTAPVAAVAPADMPTTLAIGFEPRGGIAALEADARSVSDPASPTFRQYLSPSTAAAVYSPTAAVYDPIAAWARNANFSLTEFSNRLVIGLDGTIEDVEAAFHVNMYLALGPDGTQFYVPDREPSIDATVPLFSVQGLDDRGPTTLGVGSGTQGSITSGDVRSAYAGCTSRRGAGELLGIAVVGKDNVDLNDITAYESNAGIPPVRVRTLALDKAARFSPALEPSLDVEMAIAIAPGLSGVDVIEGKRTNTVYAELATSIPLHHEISSSYFAPDIDAVTQALANIFAVQGQSFSQASGDNGGDGTQLNHRANNIDIKYATLVGGTDFYQFLPGIKSEQVWSDSANTRGSGGGILATSELPYYQVGLDQVDVAHGTFPLGASTTHRNVPDVAMVAKDIYVQAGGSPIYSVWGTSAASPLWAGFMALVNEQGQANGVGYVGFANPLIYQIAKSSSLYADAFHDVVVGGGYVSGTGTAFPAEQGYDWGTGWGSPRCNLIDILSPSPPVKTEITHIAASSTQFGPYVCLSGQGFFRGRDVHFTYDGIPGRTAPWASGTLTPVAADGTFSVTDTFFASPGGILVSDCTDEQLTLDQVTVTATDNANTATSTLPAYLWCGNSKLSGANGGCH